MMYQITKEEAHLAKNPHHIFNLNVILVHLAASQIILELSHGNFAFFLLIPTISTLVFIYIYNHGKQVAKTQTWFVAANWTLAWRRGRMMLIAYAIAVVVIVVTNLIGSISEGMMMNDFSDDDTSSSIISTIGVFFGAVAIFFVMLINFLLTGISVYDAGKGIIDEKITEFIPRDKNSNKELAKDKEA